jgi:SAM-dependent methyltransferase
VQSDYPICNICGKQTDYFFKDCRTYYKCQNCYLIFTNQTIDKENQDKHFQSQITDDASFWRRVADTYIQLASQFIVPKQILDFGSGNGDLSNALKDRGYIVYSYEPRIHGEFTEQKYPSKFDMIIGNQVIEHLSDPSCEIRALYEVLHNDGILFITSSFTDHFVHSHDACEYFRNWWFKDDMTHVSFYCYWTLQFICNCIGLEIVSYGPIAAIMRKQLNDSP